MFVFHLVSFVNLVKTPMRNSCQEGRFHFVVCVEKSIFFVRFSSQNRLLSRKTGRPVLFKTLLMLETAGLGETNGPVLPEGVLLIPWL